MRSSSDISENRFLGSISTSNMRNFFQKSASPKPKNGATRAKTKFYSENIAPIDPNIQISDPPLLPSSNSFPKKSPSKIRNVQKDAGLKSECAKKMPEAPDPPVKVVVRIKPDKALKIGERTVKKVAEDSLSIGDRKFSFDSVFDSDSTQEDVFQLIGLPLVKNALAGYNTSLLAYGQTGSGKTYTLWGPPSAMVESPLVNGQQGIVPRIFQMLFTKIQREQENSEAKKINYQCRCSFLEIYDNQISDLLDTTQRNLEIRDDPKNGFYVENLSEEYVTSYEDVTQVLIKGLSSRKIGATRINSKSSRSHIVFTCVIESWSKESTSKCFGSSRSSRITLVDLAGFERNGPDDASRQCMKENKYVKKSTSQLGHLINVLAEKNYSGEGSVPYGCSRLTHLLRESLGGNAKLSVICTINADSNHDGESISTLRFGQKVKLLQNQPVVNEISEDDVNGLSDQIRQLKEELIKAKSSVSHSVGSSYGYLKGRSVRESLNQLRVSLNRSLILPHIESDLEDEVCINEDDIEDLKLQMDKIRVTVGENPKEISFNRECTQFCSAEGCETDATSEQHYMSCSEDSESEEINSEDIERKVHRSMSSEELNDVHEDSRTSLSVSACHMPALLEDPMLSESPKIRNSPRKSLVISSTYLSDKNNMQEVPQSPGLMRQSHKQNDGVSSLRSSRIFAGPTESLAASLHRGLQIIDYQQQNSAASTRSSTSFSFGHLAVGPSSSLDKVNASVQTSPGEKPSDTQSGSFLCLNCRRKGITTSSEVQDSLKTWIVPVDETKNGNPMAANVKDIKKDAIQPTDREKQLEILCKEQEEKIKHLNKLLAQYQGEAKEEGPHHIKYDNVQLLTWNCSENGEPDFIKEKCEIQEVQDKTNEGACSNRLGDEEKESLLQEIDSLRSKLKSFESLSSKRSTDRIRASLLSQSVQLRNATYAQGASEAEFEKERERWTEMESDWISLTDELRVDLESYRQRAEKVEMELKLEKKCTDELDDALKRSVLGHGRMVEHYAELQEKYNDLVEKHRLIMGGIADIKKAAAKAGAKGRSRFHKSLAAELSALRVEREREREQLKKENRSLKLQLRDTAEAVHAAGELLVRLREAEETASVAEGNFSKVQEENDKLKKQVEKMKRKHKMEMVTMKQYLAESRLPESALRPLYREDSDMMAPNETTSSPFIDDDQAWRAEFGAIYQEHY